MKTKQKDYTTYYLFTDVEGIGLNFDKDGKVLKNDLIEISYILSDENLFQMKSNTYINSFANYDYKNMVDRVKKMHTKNNLIADSKKSKLSLSEIDNKMYEELRELLPNKCRLILTGNTIQYDYEIIRRCLPKTFSLLHYRTFDVSAVRELIKIVNPNYTKQETKRKNYNHRAKDDILETFNELKAYRKIVNIITKNYCLVYSKKDYLSLYEILKRNKCIGLALYPYISKLVFENIYPKELEKKLSVEKLNHSLFDLFIASYTNQMPSFDDEYYFLPDIQPSLNQEKLKLNIKRFNEMLAYENLLINKDDVIPSLKSIFANSVTKILKAEANEETIRLKDTEIYNRNFHYLVIAEFVINASFIYKRKDIENFLINEIELERE